MNERKIYPEQARLLVFLTWLMELKEQVGQCNEKADDELAKLYLYTKHYLRFYEKCGWFKAAKFKSAFFSLNRRLDALKREIKDDDEIYPIVLAIGILRHAPFDKIRGFDMLKKIDLDSLIVYARQEKVFNFTIQRKSLDFKKYFWEV